MVKSILRLWLIYARMDLLWLLKDSQNFFLYTATDVIINFASIAGIWLIAVRFEGIGGMGIYQILFMLGYSTVVSGVINTFFSFNVFFISRIIGRGQIDHVLIMPQPVWITMLTEGFVPISGSGVLLSGVGIIIFSLAKIGNPTSVIFIALLIMCILLSTIISVSFSVLVGSLAFYSPVSAEEVCTSVSSLFTSLKNFPLNGFGTASTIILLSVLPVGSYAWFPSIALLGLRSHVDIAIFAAISLAYLILVMIVFRKGLSYYVENGSSRYTDRGHRR